MSNGNEIELSEELVSNKIYYIRNQKVMLDSDLAMLYGIETKVLKQAVKRNISRFPEDFMFEITEIEYHSLRSQFVTLKKGRGQHQKYLPFAFTEYGVLMLSSVQKKQKGDTNQYSNHACFFKSETNAIGYK
jgi:ORF6N domain